MSAKTTPKGLKEVTYNDAVARSKEYFGGDELAATVWVSQIRPQRLRSAIFTKARPKICTTVSPPRSNASRRTIPTLCRATRSSTLLDRLPLRHPAGRPDDRYRQQSANRFAVELLRHRPQEARRLLRRHHPHGRGAGADHETARRRGTRSLAPAPHGQSRAQLARSRRRVSSPSWSVTPTRRARWRRTAAAVR